ncbi:MAG TPA: O-antigen ligase family protein [Arenimonas sp.]|nr:O-antigen ligase family protein [Arenimonas sp.]
MNSSAPDSVFRWAPYWILAFVALWPTVGVAEAVMSLGALLGFFLMVWQKLAHRSTWLSREAWLMTLVFFLAYWLPELFSAFDAINAKRAWREVLFDLRYLPFLWLIALSVSNEKGRQLIFSGLAIISLFWALDGMVQVLTGFSLGGAMTEDRLSGIFGSDNLKLGLVLAALSPFTLDWANKRGGVWAWCGVALLVGTVVLWAGARAGWVMFGLVILISGWQVLGRKRLLLFFFASTLVLLLSYFASPELRARFERTETALAGETGGVDHALSGRISIWKTALKITADHPVNGVGVRNFRDVYKQYADKDDPFISADQQGAYHAHHWLLEVLSETGVIGLLCWMAGFFAMWRAWQWSPPKARQLAFVPMLACVVVAFPLNTHLAFYATFWGGCWLLLLALYAGCLGARDRFET